IIRRPAVSGRIPVARGTFLFGPELLKIFHFDPRIDPRTALKNVMRRRSNTVVAALLATVVSPLLLRAQEEGGELTVPEVVVVPGTRQIVLPPSRKAEVFDTTLYNLPAGDSLIFGERITNLQGDGGPLPAYGEFDDPLTLNAEASVGTFV